MRKKAPILMFIRGSGLSVKITGMLLGFFLVALAAIALTLFISWHLEGAAAAINDAMRRVEEVTKERMAGFTAGMNLPAGMKLPF